MRPRQKSACSVRCGETRLERDLTVPENADPAEYKLSDFFTPSPPATALEKTPCGPYSVAALSVVSELDAASMAQDCRDS